MKALISVKPVYVTAILNGDKRCEYRRTIFKRTDVDTLAIYATAPVKRVVAEVSIRGILTSTPQALWERTHQHGGISKEQYMHYFHDTDTAHAIVLGAVHEFAQPLRLSQYAPTLTRPPQSYAYMPEHQ